MSSDKIKIDIVSDIVCPWCIIGYKRLEKALEIAGNPAVEIVWHPFELNPDMQQEGENLRSHLAAKYGTTLEGSIKARANLTNIGRTLGFEFDYFDEMMMYNTFNAHQAIQFANTKGKAQQMTLRLFAAFFGERKNVGQIEVLVEEAVAVGLNKADVEHVLSTQMYSENVRAEQQKFRQLGINSVPTYIFNNRQMVSGAHEAETLAQFISNQVLGEV